MNKRQAKAKCGRLDDAGHMKVKGTHYVMFWDHTDDGVGRGFPLTSDQYCHLITRDEFNRRREALR